MRVFFDQNVPRNLRPYLARHAVQTAVEMGWPLLENGALLTAAELAGFEVFVTGDQNLAYQQTLTHRTIAIVGLTRNNWPLVRLHIGRSFLQ